MQKKIISLLTIFTIVITTFLSGCSVQKNTEPFSKSNFYFDTIITITLYEKDSEKYIDECFSIASKYENLLSNTKKNSELSKINANPNKYVKISSDTLEVIKAGIEYGKKSNDIFDITIGKITDLWNFSEISENSKSDSNEVDPSVIPEKTKIDELLPHVNYNNIKISGNKVMLTDSNAKIDLGGIAKGFIADKMKEYLHKQHITSGIINLGGNVLTLGEKPDSTKYNVGIQKPFSSNGESLGYIKVNNKSVVTSGVYERYYRVNGKLYHHIIDTSTGYPVNNNLVEVTIISDKSVDGDALSTTCFSMGLKKGLKYIESLKNVDAIFITSDNKVYHSKGFNDFILTDKDYTAEK
ncbi:thiamine biosynthesis lipoprotein [Lachnospiraceae bacterium C7]|nr:thiamine biosynthesis lipoprotein [Lachnospiraceae bacterium C7]